VGKLQAEKGQQEKEDFFRVVSQGPGSLVGMIFVFIFESPVFPFP
jgi:hypothetical protein